MFKTQNLYQNDDKWKNVKLGNSSISIGEWGCLMTSVAMLLNGIGYNETPESVNDKMKRAGGFHDALFIPSVVPRVWSNCVYRDMQNCESYPAPIAQIDAAVQAGKPVILQVDWSKQVGVQTHFVLVKEKRGDDYVIYDPYKYGGDAPGKDVLLTSRYKYNGARPETEISAVLWFDSYNIAAPEPPQLTLKPVPVDCLTLYAAEDDLALRAEPSTSGYLWKRLMRGTELAALEAKDSARSKIGVMNQWINVQDPDEDQGFVAAWYTSANREQPAAMSVSTPPAAGKLPPGALAFVPTEELSFRTRPVIAPETVIRRIPVTEQVISVEPVDDVIRKVGVTGEWLRVKDSTDREGYVAAWYVRYASGSTAQQMATPAASASSNGGPLKVWATAEGVALRRQPVVSDATLIKRLPLGTELLVLEPNAASKIGKNDQWLQVQDPAGSDGYVAAWFVAR
jgi:hypothetical protein